MTTSENTQTVTPDCGHRDSVCQFEKQAGWHDRTPCAYHQQAAADRQRHQIVRDVMRSHRGTPAECGCL